MRRFTRLVQFYWEYVLAALIVYAACAWKILNLWPRCLIEKLPFTFVCLACLLSTVNSRRFPIRRCVAQYIVRSLLWPWGCGRQCFLLAVLVSAWHAKLSKTMVFDFYTGCRHLLQGISSRCARSEAFFKRLNGGNSTVNRALNWNKTPEKVKNKCSTSSYFTFYQLPVISS